MPPYSNRSTEVLIEMPRWRSISIQSEVVLRLRPFAFTAPAKWIAPP
jgi:hypothetical protein